MENLGALVPLVLVVGMFWLFIIRPAKRRQREHAATQAAAVVGSDVMTASGLFGRIVGESDDRLRLEIADGVVVEIHRHSIGQVLDADHVDESSDDRDL